jgi:hypothetical protein
MPRFSSVGHAFDPRMLHSFRSYFISCFFFFFLQSKQAVEVIGYA